MRKVLLILVALIASCFSVGMQYFIVNGLASPYNHIDFVLVYLLLVVIFFGLSSGLTTLIPCVFLLELFSASVFGIVSISTFISCLVFAWVLERVLTNRSSYIIFLASVAAVFSYQLIFFILSIVISAWVHTASAAALYEVFRGTIFWKIIETSTALSILYIFCNHFVHGLRGNHASKGSFFYVSTKSI